MTYRRRTQEVDADASFSVEEEGAEEGYYIGVIGAILKWTMTMMAGVLLISTQTAPDALPFVFIIVVFYILGWIMTREAGMPTLTTYETVLDTLGIGIFFGFVIRVVEGVTLRATTGLFEMNLLGPFETFMTNAPALGEGIVIVAVGLVFASVAEEMLHRGGMIYLVNVLDERRGMPEDRAKALALMAQAALFAVLHAAVYQRPEELIALFAGGIVYGLLLFWKKDLSVCILAHLTLNMTVLAPYIIQYLVENPVMAIIFGLVTGLLLYCMSYRGGDDYE